MITLQALRKIIKDNQVLVLDGGQSTVLERRGFNLQTPLWTAGLLQSHPQAVVDLYQTYLAAGADCIGTLSYQATIPGFMKQGLSLNEAEDLLRKSVSLAIDAREGYLNTAKLPRRFQPLIAACIGPYGAYLANGAEYHGRYGITRQELYDFHSSRLSLLADTRADLIAFETIPGLAEAEILLELLKVSPATSAWMSFSCRDVKHISDGTPIAACAELLKACEQILAIGINCTAPALVSPLIKEILKIAPEKLVAVYPNSGQQYDGGMRRWTGRADPVRFGEAAAQWYDDGARLIGGCCQTGPAHIQAIRNQFNGN